MSAVAVARPEHLNRWPLGGTRVVCSLDHLVGAGEQRWRRVHGPSILRSEPSIDNLLCFENNCFFETLSQAWRDFQAERIVSPEHRSLLSNLFRLG
jgi:hypothetical protein